MRQNELLHINIIINMSHVMNGSAVMTSLKISTLQNVYEEEAVQST